MPSNDSFPNLHLASTSPFRKALLEKLQLPFSTDKPEIDETPLKNETTEALIKRLSIAKARKVAEDLPSGSIVIGSDQSATFQGNSIGKPHTYDNATQQLRSFSGQSITFLTGLAVIDTSTKTERFSLDKTIVHFRELTDTDIHNYLIMEEPYQCAGSFKSEGLGISLFEKIESQDPNALIGLPLIQLCQHLRDLGLQIPYVKSR